MIKSIPDLVFAFLSFAKLHMQIIFPKILFQHEIFLNHIVNFNIILQNIN